MEAPQFVTIGPPICHDQAPPFVTLNPRIVTIAPINTCSFSDLRPQNLELKFRN